MEEISLAREKLLERSFGVGKKWVEIDGSRSSRQETKKRGERERERETEHQQLALICVQLGSEGRYYYYRRRGSRVEEKRFWRGGKKWLRKNQLLEIWLLHWL